ncbi:MAG TPA: diguanylate cyclase [Baekduia sp.]|nr:diguanylate cyclase [Baekduia sp.]
MLRQAAGLPLGPLNAAVDEGGYTAIEVAATAMVWARASRRGREQRAWLALAGWATLWCVGDLGWTLRYDHVENPPFPNWTDPVYIVSYGCAYVGMVVLIRARSDDPHPSRWLDGLIGGLTLAAACAALFLGPVFESAEGSVSAVAVTLAYPVLDVLLLCVVGVAFGTKNWRPGAAWAALGASMAVSAVGDAAYSWQQAVGSYSAASWVNCTWPAAMVLLAWAAWSPAPSRLEVRETDGMFGIPATCAAMSLAILVWSQFRSVDLLATMAAAGAVATAGLRSWLTHRENLALLRRSRREALEDGLTGLPNRRRLLVDLECELRDRPARSSTLVFFDLDGFKSYNDNFGHGAGDALLVRLARALAASVDGIGEAYRLGGDEFCVLFDREAHRDGADVARAATALSEDGEGFAITSSYGLVALPHEADTPSRALQLADERMYGHKGSRRGSPSRQGRDLLLQVLREREPALEEHVDDVGTLALAVGRELGLDVEALDEIARGAELHDIGKVAVPEAILHKRGPLDAAEWQVMRQHTIVGERILSAAPALRPVARLVRSSHEQWDGSGYPDGLAGGRIPLGARIISVCDAFDAMRQARPYANSMSEAAALAELRRCAGTQFDPRVVDAFAKVLAAGAGQDLRVA